MRIPDQARPRPTKSPMVDAMPSATNVLIAAAETNKLGRLFVTEPEPIEKGQPDTRPNPPQSRVR